MTRPPPIQALFSLLFCGLAACLLRGAPPAPDASQPSTAPSQPSSSGPTPESVRKMIEATGVEKLNDSVIHQLDGMTESIVAHTFHGKGVSPQAVQLEDAARKRLQAIIREDLSWDKMAPVYVRIYTRNFSQAEVDEITAFYQTKAQQAYAARIQQITKDTFGEIQQRIGPIMQKMQDAMKEAKDQVDAAEKAAAPAPPAPAPAGAPTPKPQ